jgi:Rrf2 family nitric oxide-sensitive transcriptional repressor
LRIDPADINIGDVVRNTETDFYMAECFEPGNTACGYSASCGLKGVLRSATAAYLEVLDGVTLDSLVRKELKRGGKTPVVETVRFHAKAYKK